MKNLLAVAGAVIVVGAVTYAVLPTPLFLMHDQIRSSMTEWTPDPLSLQLADLRRSENDESIICGKMNAKNRLGAYVGFKNFAYSQKQKFTFLEGLDPSADSMISLFECGT